MEIENYEIVAPNKKRYGTAITWNEAVDKAVELSLSWGVRFSVRRMYESTLPFQRERLRVLETSLDYLELARTHPKSISCQKAKSRFETAKRKLDILMEVHKEFEGSDFTERHEFNHPVKGFRTY